MSGTILNATSPIEVTPSGMVIEIREEHPLKVASPIEVTEFGMVIEVREEHNWNV